MNDNIDTLKKCDAIKTGHFKLTSGRHSDLYVQCAQLFQYPEYAKKLCDDLALKISEIGININTLVAPAVGGLLFSYQMSQSMGVRNIFAERVDGNFQLRRNFLIAEGEKIAVCEDVVTTGGSVNEVIAMLRKSGAEVVAVISLIDRSAGQAKFDVPFYSLVKLDIDSFEQSECPLCKEGVMLNQPGSRAL